MNTSLKSQIAAYKRCRSLLHEAVSQNSEELDFKAFDTELIELYDSILNARPQNPQEARLLVNFLLDQLEFLNDLSAHKLEIEAIRQAVDLFMLDK